jgi:hypothetical protein
MDIECKLHRAGGTRTSIDTTEYHFAPREDGAHVADVINEAHQDRFLSIAEGYCLYRGSAPAPKAEPVAVAKAAPVKPAAPVAPSIADNILLGSSEHPASFEIHGKTYSLGDIVARAHTASGLDVKEWNELEDQSRADLVDEQLDLIKAADAAPVDEAAVRAELAAQYEAKFHKKPHYNLSVEKLRAAISA